MKDKCTIKRLKKKLILKHFFFKSFKFKFVPQLRKDLTDCRPHKKNAKPVLLSQ